MKLLAAKWSIRKKWNLGFQIESFTYFSVVSVESLNRFALPSQQLLWFSFLYIVLVKLEEFLIPFSLKTKIVKQMKEWRRRIQGNEMESWNEEILKV